MEELVKEAKRNADAAAISEKKAKEVDRELEVQLSQITVRNR